MPSVRSVFHIIPAGIMWNTLEVDSSVHLMQHDWICLVKKCKIHFRILSNLKVKADHFDIFCKIKETLFIQELEPVTYIIIIIE